MSGHYFNTINLWRLAERSGCTASRDLKKLLGISRASFGKDAPRRSVRGFTRHFEVLTEKDDPSRRERNAPERKFLTENDDSFKRERNVPERKFVSENDDSFKRERRFLTENDDFSKREAERKPRLSKSKIKDLLENSVAEMVEEDPNNYWVQKEYPKKYYKSEVKKERNDPKDHSIFLFPGQGSQFVGMGKNLVQYPNVARMYTIASEILGFNLLDICLNGPKEELNKTVHCQPAVIVSSLAALEKFRDQSPQVIDTCVAAAGFSVGEITALIFTGVLSFEDGLKLTRVRAEAMQSASEQINSGMMTVFYGADGRVGFACNAAVEWCRQETQLDQPECQVANYLFPGCKVLAGHTEALNFIKMNAKDFGIRGLKELPVSGAFHTRLMEGAASAVRLALKSMRLNEPSVPVYSNQSGKPYFDAEHIRRQLPKQISAPVKWEQLMNGLYQRNPGLAFPSTFEVGPGKTLTSILERVNGKAWDLCTSVPA